MILLGLETKPVGGEGLHARRDDAISIASPMGLGLLSSFQRSFQRHGFASVEVEMRVKEELQKHVAECEN